MRHRRKVKKLGRDFQHRRLMLRNLFTSLLDKEKIKTTEAKAKELVRLTNRLIEGAKSGDLHSRRQVAKYITNKEVYKKFFGELLPVLSPRVGGHVRMVRLGYRKGDGAMLSQVELIKEAVEKGKKH